VVCTKLLNNDKVKEDTMIISKETVVSIYKCDVCGKEFTRTRGQHIYDCDFCNWDCAYTDKGQALIKAAELKAIAKTDNRIIICKIKP
jgi:ribosomal protein L37AE/L43A